MMTSSNAIDLTIDSNFNIANEISIMSYPYVLNFKLVLQFVAKIPAILCFQYLQSDDVISFDRFSKLFPI